MISLHHMLLLCIAYVLLTALSVGCIDLQDFLNTALPLPITCNRSPIIGNHYFNPENRLKYPHIPVPKTPTDRSICIVIFSVYIHSTLLNATALNHQQYADKHGYSFIHVTMSRGQFEAYFGLTALGWVNLEVAKILFERHPEIDYLMKVDVDCLFATNELSLETIIDPLEQYDFYINQIEHSRFTQSHTWVLRNSPWGMDFLKRWNAYRNAAYCRDIAQEQGALHFMLGLTLKEAYPKTGDFECHMVCHTTRSTWLHHHCVLNWYDANHFGMAHNFSHPHVFLYPFPGTGQYVSPKDGFSVQIGMDNISKMKNKELFKPLTVHPCKVNPFMSPDYVMDHLADCF